MYFYLHKGSAVFIKTGRKSCNLSGKNLMDVVLVAKMYETSLPIVNVPSLQKSKGELPNRSLAVPAKSSLSCI